LLCSRVLSIVVTVCATVARLVAIDHDGAFDDLRFHDAPFELKAGSYRDSLRAKRKGQAVVGAWP
jgi:hypothetical protein